MKLLLITTKNITSNPLQFKPEMKKIKGGRCMPEVTAEEKKDCEKIVRCIFGSDDEEKCQKQAEEILKIAYAIGAGFDEKTLTEIAQSLYKIR